MAFVQPSRAAPLERWVLDLGAKFLAHSAVLDVYFRRTLARSGLNGWQLTTHKVTEEMQEELCEKGAIVSRKRLMGMDRTCEQTFHGLFLTTR